MRRGISTIISPDSFIRSLSIAGRDFAMDYILETNSLTKQYQAFTLFPLQLQIPYGKITGLIGENGAGKTTLISLLLNQFKRDGGRVTLFGLDAIRHEMQCKQRIGFVMDTCCFHDCLSPKNICRIMQGIYPSWSDS